MSGAGVADVLFGDYSPAGRLPVTFYRSLDQIPPFPDYHMRGRTYRFFDGEPLYPFGYGLSYTRFAYDNLRITPGTLVAGKTFRVSVAVDVDNVGPHDGDEVVQLYVTRMNRSADAPLRQLQGFKRIRLRTGERRTAHFEIEPIQLASVDENGTFILHPDEFRISLGGRQPLPSKRDGESNVVEKILRVTGEAVAL